MLTAKEVLILYPSGRPLDVSASIARAFTTTQHPMTFYVALNHSHNAGAVQIDGAFTDHVYIDDFGDFDERSLVQIINCAFDRLVEHYRPADDTLIGYWADDFYPEPGWLEALYAAADAHPEMQFFQCNDGYSLTPDYPGGTVPFVRYRWYRDNNHGVFFPPIYRRFGCDCDNARRARLEGVYLCVWTSNVLHHHWKLDKRPIDDLDRRGLDGHEWGDASHPDWKLLYQRIRQHLPVVW